MNIEELREYCIRKPFVTEEFPFGPDVIVYKVKGKMFLLLPLDTDVLQFNCKNLPDENIALRENYAAIQPGYHMAKKHWNTIICDGTLDDSQILTFVDISFKLVVEGLPKALRF
ncbi:MAG: MmcQ/YjbR family DNA-binding protein [Chitinophagales bacterium]|nr:MmcQ/YjbR family DNA-binding protein [Chitinophagales bacterium]